MYVCYSVGSWCCYQLRITGGGGGGGGDQIIFTIHVIDYVHLKPPNHMYKHVHVVFPSICTYMYFCVLFYFVGEKEMVFGGGGESSHHSESEDDERDEESK